MAAGLAMTIFSSHLGVASRLYGVRDPVAACWRSLGRLNTGKWFAGGLVALKEDKFR